MVEPENPQRLYQSIREFWKATFEYFKTYSTIRLASIAACAGLLAGAFQNPPPATDSMLSLIPYVSSQLLGWFDNHRSIFMTVPFFTLTFAGYFTLVGTQTSPTAFC
jgi:hypothetical protein